MSHRRDYYEILHVHPEAPTEIIRSSYRTLMQRLKQHPDLGGDHENAALINEAYATLTDPQRRAAYDRSRANPSSPGVSRDTPPPSPERTPTSWHTYRGMGLGFCGFCKAAHDYGIDAPEDAICDGCASPLRRVERHTTARSGLRALERFPKRQVIRFYQSWPESNPASGVTRDISLDGMQFETTSPVGLNQMIKIDSDVCKAIARVAHVTAEDQTLIVGVEFLTLRFEKVQGSFVSAQA